MIKEELLTEAQALLVRVDSVTAEGKRELLLGYIFALQSECEQAEEMFAQAQGVNKDIVVPADYRARCEEKGAL